MFLLFGAGDFVTGQTIVVDGGKVWTCELANVRACASHADRKHVGAHGR